MNAAGNYMAKVNNRSTRARFEICSKLTMKTSERSQLNAGWEVYHKIKSRFCK